MSYRDDLDALTISHLHAVAELDRVSTRLELLDAYQEAIGALARRALATGGFPAEFTVRGDVPAYFQRGIVSEDEGWITKPNGP